MSPRLSIRIISTLFLFTTISCGPGNSPTVKDSISPDTAPTIATEPAPGVTFTVSDVDLPATLLTEVNFREALEGRIGKQVFVFPESQQNEKVVPVAMNGFVQTIHDCYAQHRPLILSPDDIWLTLCQGFSIHLNLHFDSLRTQVFTEDKPVDIIVRNDSLVNGNAANWEQLIAGLSEKTKAFTRSDVYGTIVQDFSTTSEIEHTAFEITLLEVQQKAFSYIGESGCGIPRVTLEGSVEDWKKVSAGMQQFRKFGLDYWVKEMEPVLQQFIAAAEGKADKKFWESIYKETSEYNATYISGWMLKLFPYVKEKEYDGPMESFHYIPNKFLRGEEHRRSKLQTKDLPGGFSKISVQWNAFSPLVPATEMKKMEIYAGFIAIRQDSASKALSPIITWAVCEKDAKKVEQRLPKNEPVNLQHR